MRHSGGCSPPPSQSLATIEMAVTDPASPAGIAQVLVTLLTPTLSATVDTAVQKGLEQLHIELQTQAQRLTHAEEWISPLKDDSTANSAVFACISTSNRDIL